ncbi:MAG: transposase [Candidatus Poribacteria bacterium]|nr:transposase [Candidatus Poribacteria bacterium]
MDLLFCLEGILSDFRHLFNQQNFAVFQAFIFGFIANRGRGTLTDLYQSSGSQTKYWSFPKFLSRGQWNADAVAGVLIRRIQDTFTDWVYVYDETKALKTGKSQWGLHFFRNFSYQKHRVNQSKFHYGHEFGALGLLCRTPSDWHLFPVWVKLILPESIRDKSQAVLKRICSKIAPGLIIFDRGFARRKVFTMALNFGHHILCRAKSNAVFYRLPKPPKRPQRGRPRKYGDRLDIRRLRYTLVDIGAKSYSIASKIVRTKMCDAEVRVVVIRNRPKPSKPYRYFCVFTTDLTLEIPKIVEYYRQRWQIETAFRDAKEHFGFDAYRSKSRKSINRFVQLSFLAASLTKLLFTTPNAMQKAISVEKVCEHLDIHWYRPEKLTQGLRVAYLRSQIAVSSFLAKFNEKTNSQNIHVSFQDDTPLPFDKAA